MMFHSELSRENGKLTAQNEILKAELEKERKLRTLLEEGYNRIRSHTYGDDFSTPEGLARMREKLREKEKELAVREANTKTPELERRVLAMETENKYLKEYLTKLEVLIKVKQ